MTSLFTQKHKYDGHLDLSLELEDADEWNCGVLYELPHILNVSAFAFDAVLGLFAVGELNTCGRASVDSFHAAP